jgi:hypothetical protein
MKVLCVMKINNVGTKQCRKFASTATKVLEALSIEAGTAQTSLYLLLHMPSLRLPRGLFESLLEQAYLSFVGGDR